MMAAPSLFIGDAPQKWDRVLCKIISKLLTPQGVTQKSDKKYNRVSHQNDVLLSAVKKEKLFEK